MKQSIAQLHDTEIYSRNSQWRNGGWRIAKRAEMAKLICLIRMGTRTTFIKHWKSYMDLLLKMDARTILIDSILPWRRYLLSRSLMPSKESTFSPSRKSQCLLINLGSCTFTFHSRLGRQFYPLDIYFQVHSLWPQALTSIKTNKLTNNHFQTKL